MMAAKKKTTAEQLLESLSSSELLTLVRAAKALSRPRRASKVVADWTKELRTCPKCGHHGPVDPDFGVKLVRGVARGQSWCRTCRSSTSYYNKPRVRKTAATKC